jgi:prepilin-type N-terminal cleavage/methylation domain-containing protein/prepilin-type processing-associated H-X9-DG protein
MHSSQQRRSRTGLTLVEVLVVIAVVAILAALLVPAVQAARESARRVNCSNNLHQIGVALTGYQQARRVFPIGCIECTPGRNPPGQPMRMIAWNVATLPYLELADLFDLFNYAYPAKSQENRKVTHVVVPAFLCPSTPRTFLTTGDRNGNGRWDPGDDMAFTDYGGIYGVEGPTRSAPLGSRHYLNRQSLGVMLYEEATAPATITDGLSQTVIVGECAGRGAEGQSEWANGHNVFAQEENTGINKVHDNELYSYHADGAQVVFADGHVQFLNQAIEQAVLNALLTRAGGESQRLP